MSHVTSQMSYYDAIGGGFGGKKESGQLRFGGRDRPYKRPMYAYIYASITHRMAPIFVNLSKLTILII